MNSQCVRAALLAGLMLAASPLIADDTGQRLGRDELAALLPGAEVTHISRAGSVRHWTNGPDGKFVASSDNRKFGSATGSSSATASGTWRLSDEGRYCVQIAWRREPESWCAYILRGPDGAYYLGAVEDARRIEFRRP